MRLSRPGQAFGRYLALSRKKQTKLLPLIRDHQRWPWPNNNERVWTPSTPLPSVKCAHQVGRVCVLSSQHFQHSVGQPGMVANPARDQLSGENFYFPVPVRACDFFVS